MLRFTGIIVLLIISRSLSAQKLITRDEAVQLALNNQRNVKAAYGSVQQQKELLKGAAGIDNPQVFVEATPYEPLIAGVQQTFSLPSLYRNRKAVQEERIRLAQLQLTRTEYDLKRDVRLSYLQIQFLKERERIIFYQDSIYQDIKISAQRFFDAGQINKLEELQAETQADRIRNELLRVQAELDAEKQIFVFLTNFRDSFLVERMENYPLSVLSDTAVNNIQQQILQQQISINQRQLQLERSELLPQIQAGVSFPTTSNYERPVGYQVGISLPIWRKQNRSRIAAAQAGIEVASAQGELEQQRLNARYRQALANFQREAQSLSYFNQTALPQARAIIETSRRLFQGGQLNYIESLRNLQLAFDIFTNHVNTHRAYNEAVIQLNYLNGTL